jgi:hypothetical protein
MTPCDPKERDNRPWTAGPWQWYGEVKNGEPYLATTYGGRIYVLDVDSEITSCTNCDDWGDESHTRNPDCECASARGVLRFQTDHLMRNAHEFAKYEVLRGETADPADKRLYRHQYIGFDHPDAKLIALAPELAEVVLMIADSSRMHDGFCGEMPDEMREAIESMGDRLHALGVPVNV